MQIHIYSNGQQSGPYSLEDIRTQLAKGTLQPSDIAWYEGAADWLPVSSIPGIAGNAPSPPPIPRQMPPSVPRQEASGLAIASMVLGILGFALGFLTGFAAVICGHIALSRIKGAGGALAGRGFAITGLVTGYISVFLVLVVAMLAAIALLASSSVQARALEVKSLSQAKEIALACKLYAQDNNGKFPDNLDQLVPTYLQETKLFMDPMDPNHVPMGYEYFGGKDSDPPDKILLRSKVVKNHMRVVVHCDMSGVLQRE